MAWLPLQNDEHQVLAEVEAAAPRQAAPDDAVFEDGGVCGYRSGPR